MPARPFAPTNVIRQDIELLDNLKASGNIALYEEARAAVFDKYPEPIPIDATIDSSLASALADKLQTFGIKLISVYSVGVLLSICLLYTSDAADE